MFMVDCILDYKVNGNQEAYRVLMETFTDIIVRYVGDYEFNCEPKIVYAKAFKALQDAIENYDTKNIVGVAEHVHKYVERAVEPYFVKRPPVEASMKQSDSVRVIDINIEPTTEEITEADLVLFKKIDMCIKSLMQSTGSPVVPLGEVQSMFGLPPKMMDKYIRHMMSTATSKYVGSKESGEAIAEMCRSIFGEK